MDETRRSPEQITIVLGRAEALTLFEFLARQEQIFHAADSSIELRHPAEGVALSGLLCLLEKQLVEPFAQDGSYTQRIQEAWLELHRG
jgi:hypothetical protein